LFIGKLPTTVTEELLRQIFAPYGNIEKLNILKGIPILGLFVQPTCSHLPHTFYLHRAGPADVNCGFVKYDNREEAEKAIRALNGKVVVRVTIPPSNAPHTQLI
jgi:RNA recognition motif-containing protein